MQNMESNLTFAEYINHIKWMEKHDTADVGIHRVNNRDRTSGGMESPTLNDDSRSTTPTERVCRVSNTK
jgi:hypothetical protein